MAGRGCGKIVQSCVIVPLLHAASFSFYFLLYKVTLSTALASGTKDSDSILGEIIELNGLMFLKIKNTDLLGCCSVGLEIITDFSLYYLKTLCFMWHQNLLDSSLA